MLDFGLDESSAEEMKARVLKHMIETVLPILLEPDPSDPKSQENPKSQDIRKQESNIFNHFATVLLQSCEDLDTDEVWLYTYMHVARISLYETEVKLWPSVKIGASYKRKWCFSGFHVFKVYFLVYILHCLQYINRYLYMQNNSKNVQTA